MEAGYVCVCGCNTEFLNGKSDMKFHTFNCLENIYVKPTQVMCTGPLSWRNNTEQFYKINFS